MQIIKKVAIVHIISMVRGSQVCCEIALFMKMNGVLTEGRLRKSVSRIGSSSIEKVISLVLRPCVLEAKRMLIMGIEKVHQYNESACPLSAGLKL